MLVQITNNPSQIPPNAKLLTEDDVISRQRILVRDWPNESDVYGQYVAAGLGFLTSTIISKHFRVNLNLGTAFRFWISFPVGLIPTAILIFNFDKRVTNKVLLMNTDCTLCWQMRYSLLQTTAGVIQPTITSAVLASFFALTNNTAKIPDMSTAPKEYFRFMFNIVKKNSLKFQSLFAFHILISVALPYMQEVELTNIRNIVRQEIKKSETW